MEAYLSSSSDETLRLARDFSRRLQPGQRVGLRGELGAGKTCFAKGVVSERTGIDPNDITSPTFTLMEEYDGSPKLYHLDLYRISTPQEGQALPWDEIFGGSAITLIEWPEHLENVLANCHFLVTISKGNDTSRRIEILEKGSA